MGIRIKHEPRRPAASLSNPFNTIESDVTWSGIKDDATIMEPEHNESKTILLTHENKYCSDCGALLANPKTGLCFLCEWKVEKQK